VKDETFVGNIPRLIELVRRFLKIAFKDYYYLDISLGKFIKISEYPEDAWLEGMVNALCHRSYHLQGNRVYIKHFDDRIEISNS
jgi:ATP-dependent DNA helicase RecG